MEQHAEAKLTRMSDDVHFLTAPFRFGWHLIIIFVLLFLSPLIFVIVAFGLVFNEHYGLAVRHWLLSLGWFPPIWASHFGAPVTADDIRLMKIILGVFGPFAFCIWFAIVARWREVRRTGSHDEVLWANFRGFLGLVLSFVGMFVSLAFCSQHSIEGETSLVVMTAGIISPAMVWCVFGLLRMLFEFA